MIIGVPRETHRHEHRVGLTPFAVARLVQQGHQVMVESRAGEAAHFDDPHYESSGGQIVYSPDEAYRRSDIVCRMGVLSSDEIEMLRPGSLVCGFQHLAVTPRPHVERMMQLGISLIGYEMILDEKGDRPVLFPFSVMGGRMAVDVAAWFLQTEHGGRGVMMGTVPGVPPPTVLVLGAGTVGRSAARQASATGAHVIVLDGDLRRLRDVSEEFGGRVVTVMAAMERLEQYTAIADVVIGAIQIPGERSPLLVTEAMVKAMKPGSVIVDVSIDQGGCVETSRPTTIDHPVFTCHDVIHYCVPNMTANVPRTASRVLTNAALPYILRLANDGIDAALAADRGLAAGLMLLRGRMVHERTGQTLGIPVEPLDRLLGGEKRS